jgi:hypothetical protein
MCRAAREGLSAKSSFTVRFPSCSQDALLVRLHGSAACTPVAAATASSWSKIPKFPSPRDDDDDEEEDRYESKKIKV